MSQVTGTVLTCVLDSAHRVQKKALDLLDLELHFEPPDMGGWGDGAAVKSTDCFSRVPEFNSQQPQVTHNHL